MKIDMSYLKSHKTVRVLAPGLSALLLLGGIGCSGGDQTDRIDGCDGGLIGTGCGPNGLIYQLKNLPERISPDIPETLNGREDTTTPNSSGYGNNELSVLLRSIDNLIPKSEGWSELSLELLLLEALRLDIKTNSTIVDLAFDDILKECAEQLLDCTIPADRISVTITQDVVNRLIKLNAKLAESLSDTFFPGEDGYYSDEGLSDFIKTLLNKEVVLGKTHYSQLDGAPYDHAISTVLKRGSGLGEHFEFDYWDDVDFSVRWREDNNVAKFTSLRPEEGKYEYFYQKLVTSELVTSHIMLRNVGGYVNDHYATILGSDPNQAGILVEATSMAPSYSETVVETTESGTSVSHSESDGLGFVTGTTVETGSATTTVDGMLVPTDTANSDPVVIQSETETRFTDRAYQAFRGKIDNSGGYSSSDVYRFDLTEDQNLISYKGSRESFERNGNLLAGEQCGFVVSDQTTTNCNENSFESFGPQGSSLIDSVHYFTPDEFDLLAADEDSIRWELKGIPSEIESIGVISSDIQNELSESKLLCRAVQYVAEDVRVFCTATDEQLDSTIVVELVNGLPTRIIANAKLVQIQ